MMKTLQITLILSFSLLWSQTFEGIVYQKVGAAQYFQANSGVINVYVGSVTATPSYSSGYTLGISSVTFVDNNPQTCSAMVGNYNLTFNGDTLIYKRTSDNCFYRTYALDNTKWIPYVSPNYAAFEGKYFQNIDNPSAIAYAENNMATFYVGAISNGPQYITSYTYAPDTIVFDDQFSAVCSTGVNGKYILKMQNDTLTYTLISDNCAERMGTLASTRWAPYEEVVTGTSDNQFKEIEIYPNPALDYFSVNTSGDVSVYDSKGTQILHKSVSSDEKILTNGFQKGLYHVKLYSEGKELKNATIVVK